MYTQSHTLYLRPHLSKPRPLLLVVALPPFFPTSDLHLCRLFFEAAVCSRIQTERESLHLRPNILFSFALPGAPVPRYLGSFLALFAPWSSPASPSRRCRFYLLPLPLLLLVAAAFLPARNWEGL
ncbi:hypothetical protein CABS01_07955 [Colletotrichum abscissum]|uniref:Uncharacterized protein n=1 Tax=Colletotrichum lupini TaxID=145971 RepID=A0A9Q8T3H4_9PEZI|nr:uncharacterized protein CLUP02_14007 [Colletotrichum lupini]XP_060402817.1 uncharacterized protein CABS01_07955 [Colletotrichum abscissum]KAI3527131.1 hypothetical protein CSPX01_17221 [Colletotrichum filicis]KAK1510283.1 hypothetical protein CABS01_07955 [Colletotrichum abscissum]KAK1716526.1 hypothetical protein BDP67DRAFT_510019 [Colletotrichum lupini]UQC88483.1 hypothetical protein CLUP02_14007 [Colletotrichum lupini]